MGAKKYFIAMRGANFSYGMQMGMPLLDIYLVFLFRGLPLPAGEKTTHILVPTTEAQEGCCKSVFVVLDASGKIVAKLESPLGDLLNRSAATPIRFGIGAEYFVVLQNSFAKERSMLLIYDKGGQIAYQEILGESCHGISTLTVPDAEMLLVGCTGKIWEYSRVPKTISAANESTPQSDR